MQAQGVRVEKPNYIVRSPMVVKVYDPESAKDIVQGLKGTNVSGFVKYIGNLLPAYQLNLWSAAPGTQMSGTPSATIARKVGNQWKVTSYNREQIDWGSAKEFVFDIAEAILNKKPAGNSRFTLTVEKGDAMKLVEGSNMDEETENSEVKLEEGQMAPQRRQNRGSLAFLGQDETFRPGQSSMESANQSYTTSQQAADFGLPVASLTAYYQDPRSYTSYNYKTPSWANRKKYTDPTGKLALLSNYGKYDSRTKISLNNVLFNGMRNEANLTWAALGQKGYASFANGKWTSSLFRPTDRNKNLQKRMDKSVAYVSTTLDPKTAASVSVPFMSAYQKVLVAAGFGGFGPRAKGGIPLFCGRYVDTNGRVKVIVKPPGYYDKTNYDQALAYAQLSAVAAWNRYVGKLQAIQNVVKYKDTWEDRKAQIQYNNAPEVKYKKQMKQAIKDIFIGQGAIRILPVQTRDTILTSFLKGDYRTGADLITNAGIELAKTTAVSAGLGQALRVNALANFQRRPNDSMIKFNAAKGLSLEDVFSQQKAPKLGGDKNTFNKQLSMILKPSAFGNKKRTYTDYQKIRLGQEDGMQLGRDQLNRYFGE